MTLEQRLERGEAEVKNVLVVDRVELATLDEIAGVGKFEDYAPAGLEQGFQAGDEVVRVWHMGEDVIAEDQVGLTFLASEILCKIVPEKFYKRFDSFFTCDLGDVRSWLDAERGNFGRVELLQEISIVAGDFDDEVFLPE